MKLCGGERELRHPWRDKRREVIGGNSQSTSMKEMPFGSFAFKVSRGGACYRQGASLELNHLSASATILMGNTNLKRYCELKRKKRSKTRKRPQLA